MTFCLNYTQFCSTCSILTRHQLKSAEILPIVASDWPAVNHKRQHSFDWPTQFWPTQFCLSRDCWPAVKHKLSPQSWLIGQHSFVYPETVSRLWNANCQHRFEWPTHFCLSRRLSGLSIAQAELAKTRFLWTVLSLLTLQFSQTAVGHTRVGNKR